MIFTFVLSPACGTQAGFRETCFPPPESAGCAKPAVGRRAELERGMYVG
jgi:hypothetical protein